MICSFACASAFEVLSAVNSYIVKSIQFQNTFFFELFLRGMFSSCLNQCRDIDRLSNQCVVKSQCVVVRNSVLSFNSENQLKFSPPVNIQYLPRGAIIHSYNVSHFYVLTLTSLAFLDRFLYLARVGETTQI